MVRCHGDIPFIHKYLTFEFFTSTLTTLSLHKYLIFDFFTPTLTSSIFHDS
jgi:hypothetical protein